MHLYIVSQEIMEFHMFCSVSEINYVCFGESHSVYHGFVLSFFNVFCRLITVTFYFLGLNNCRALRVALQHMLFRVSIPEPFDIQLILCWPKSVLDPKQTYVHASNGTLFSDCCITHLRRLWLYFHNNSGTFRGISLQVCNYWVWSECRFLPVN